MKWAKGCGAIAKPLVDLDPRHILSDQIPTSITSILCLLLLDTVCVILILAMDDVLSSELRAVFRLNLTSHDNVVSALDEEKRRAPVVRGIIEAIIFSRRFLPTYLVLVTVSVLLWGLIKRARERTERWQRKTLSENTCSAFSVSSSSSSTLQGTESPPLKDADTAETTALLAEAQLQSYNHRSVHVRLWHNTRSFLLRQPKPIFALTSPRNSLPANETSLAILAFLALNLFYLFYRMPLSTQHAFTIADRAGLLFVINLPVLYLLAAKNNQPLGWITGWSYEGLNIFHRRLGEWMTIAAIIHVVGMVIGFYQLLAPFGYTLGWYLTRYIIIFGVIGFVFYIAIYITSTGYFRQAFYEVFLVLHIFLQVAALVMLFFHHHDARPYVGAAVAIWTLDRGVSRILCKTRSFTATFEVAEDEETVLVYCTIPLRSRFGIGRGWHTGQHVFLTVPGMSSMHRWQAHPFTIASPAPPSDRTIVSWPLQLTIRAQDGFSRDLLEYAKLHQHAKVSMDGPYSSNEVLAAVKSADRVCLIAGGSGVAVTYPFAWAREAPKHLACDILHDRKLYVNGKKRIPEVKRISLSDQSRLAHFWVRQDARHESWITVLPNTMTDAVSSNASEHCHNVGRAVDLITHRFETRSATGDHQRPDIQAELEAWIKGDLKQKIDQKQSICIVVSGPDGLVRDVQNVVARLVAEGWKLQVHVEKFGW